MKLGIISDIHANLPALEVVIKKLRNENVDEIYCLGDIVGYGPYVNETIETLKKENVISVLGNHDKSLANPYASYRFTRKAQEGLSYARNIISDTNLKYLKELNYKIFLKQQKYGEKIAMLHKISQYNLLIMLGATNKLDRFLNNAKEEKTQEEENKKSFNNLFKNSSIVFFGHTHIPYVIAFKDYKFKDILGDQKSLELDSSNVYLINPGAVGHSRDKDTRTSFITYDTEKNYIKFYRENYEISRMEKKMTDSKFSQVLINRLLAGRE